MVSSDQGNVSWVLNFQGKQQLESLDRVVASINEISDKNVRLVWNFSALDKYFSQVVELAVDISANIDWCSNWLHV